ncbi:MAG: bifunctional folylpolyglutamate synthase/dihydrofolate synthase, partial [Epsilonproteobacteria bacterium]|nr:bifunctional folylpolyglutamate synthase/dihydrofolate synthase [Campylobacterota bacterium]
MQIDLNDNFLDFLNKKTLFYTKIEYDTIKKSWEILSNHIKLPYVIHIVGTNGKGTTGRFIATFLKQQNQKVLHYTSPHIVKFNERIWINGFNATDEQLENAHQKIIKILPVTLLEKLTYFEYTTLLALY